MTIEKFGIDGYCIFEEGIDTPVCDPNNCNKCATVYDEKTKKRIPCQEYELKKNK